MSADRFRIVDAVFGRGARGRASRTAFAVAIAALAHLALVVWAMRTKPRPPAPPPEPEQMVELPPPPQKPPPPPPTPSEEKQPQPAPVREARPQPQAPERPQPAQAARVVTAEPDPSAPVDLSGDTIVEGTGQVYAGGRTTSAGTSTHPVDGPEVASRPPPPSAGPDRSRPVALLEDDWACPWPHEADESEIKEQTAIVRVLVRTDGSPARASLVTDPGHGFGPAAVDCAMRQSFRSASDRDGHAIQAMSAPIVVRFTR